MSEATKQQSKYGEGPVVNHSKSLVKKRKSNSSEKKREDKIKENTEQERTGTNLNTKRLKNKKKKVNGKELDCVPMQGVTEMDGNPVPDGNEAAVLVNQKLPCELLLVLFSYFSIPDLVSVQRVCSGWRAVAQDKTLWEHFTLILSGRNEDERKVKTMPAVRNIYGFTNNNFINIILENVTELAQMNCKFTPPLTSSQTRRLIEKYPNLNSVSVDISAPDALETLNILKTSKILKEVNLGTHYDLRSDLSSLQPTDLLEIYSIFLDVSNFTGLTKISDPGRYSLGVVREPAFLNVVSDIIKRRSQQLSSLQIVIHNIASKNMVDAINMCVNLHTLCLSLRGRYEHPISINIERMTQLTSLNINTLRCSSFLPELHDCLLKKHFAHLKEVDLMISLGKQHKTEILRAVIGNMKHLTKLSYLDGNNNTSEDELKEIGNLLQLKKLAVVGLARLSEEGVSYLSQSTNLIRFALRARRSTVTDKHIANMISPMKKLRFLIIHIDENYKQVTCREEIDKFITQCNISHAE